MALELEIETLKNCRVEGNVVKLPDGQLGRNVYTEVKKRLELIGGEWKGGKVYGFQFPSDPTDLLAQIAGGDSRNLKKEFQFFATPDHLADELVRLADVHCAHDVLEPSAGQGAIVKAIQRATTERRRVFGYELMPLNQTFLNKISGFELEGDDFMQQGGRYYDRIIANPPFNKNQDIDHIRKMYECLRVGGRMVSIASKHWQNSANKKEVEFSLWLELVNAEIHEVPAGEFKESGTSIATCIIVINK